MTQKKRITRNISLSFDLTKYLMDNPEISRRYKEQEFVVFTETNNNINDASNGLVEDLQEKGRKVIKAIRRKGVKNSWRFEIA